MLFHGIPIHFPLVSLQVITKLVDFPFRKRDFHPKIKNPSIFHGLHPFPTLFTTSDKSPHKIPSPLTGAKRREWMRMGVAGIILTSDYGSFPKIPCV